ncbi:hypothetical protein F511_35361 [Dorcoceras hygrometricum]|uniref:Uncharacterized protein n=1 Tax=Dorcoceras hygrometricum TaxID=472368 RepID=A0A2Z7ARQ1_9LAMI|nr:hypothetical protein F511_35361 [Dorcoceras hygrometricum]
MEFRSRAKNLEQGQLRSRAKEIRMELRIRANNIDQDTWSEDFGIAPDEVPLMLKSGREVKYGKQVLHLIEETERCFSWNNEETPKLVEQRTSRLERWLEAAQEQEKTEQEQLRADKKRALNESRKEKSSDQLSVMNKSEWSKAGQGQTNSAQDLRNWIVCVNPARRAAGNPDQLADLLIQLDVDLVSQLRAGFQLVNFKMHRTYGFDVYTV